MDNSKNPMEFKIEPKGNCMEIRTGDLPQQPVPKKYLLNGCITAPADFFNSKYYPESKRQAETVETGFNYPLNGMLVQYSKKDKAIVYHENIFNDVGGVTITGTLKLDPDLESLRINDNFIYTPSELSQKLKMLSLLFDNRDIILFSLQHLNPLFFLGGIIFFGLFFFLKSIIWIKILEIRGHTPSKLGTIYSYSLSEIKRYIPGSIFAIMGRVRTHSKDISSKETLKGIGIEAVLLSSSALFVGIPGIYFLLHALGQNSSIATICIAGLGLLSVIGLSINIKARTIFITYLDYFFLFSLAWVFYGLG